MRAYITPYVWLPTIKAEFDFTIPNAGGSGQTATLTAVPSGYGPKLASTGMLSASVYKGNWGALTDIIYMNLTDVKSDVTSITGPGGAVTIPVNTNVQARLTSTIWTLGATYNLLPNTPPENFSAVLGFRYTRMSPSASWNFSGPLGLLPISGSHSENVTLWDGIVGAKGQFNFTDGHWYAPYYFDIGTGGAQLTYQAVGGVGYGFRHGAWSLVYRYLYYNQGNGKLLHYLNLDGPALAYTFRL